MDVIIHHYYSGLHHVVFDYNDVILSEMDKSKNTNYYSWKYFVLSNQPSIFIIKHGISFYYTRMQVIKVVIIIWSDE